MQPCTVAMDSPGGLLIVGNHLKYDRHETRPTHRALIYSVACQKRLGTREKAGLYTDGKP